MKFSKVSLQERIEQNETEIKKLKIITETFKTKYDDLQARAIKLLDEYTLEKKENERLKGIIEGLVEECNSLLKTIETLEFNNSLKKSYYESMLHYSISTLGTISKNKN
jgi:hypothetical protein